MNRADTAHPSDRSNPVTKPTATPKRPQSTLDDLLATIDGHMRLFAGFRSRM